MPNEEMCNTGDAASCGVGYSPCTTSICREATFEEASIDIKVNRLRDVIKSLVDELDRANDAISSLKIHSHIDNGDIVIPFKHVIREYKTNRKRWYGKNYI